jgi:predicted metal-dependent enzyme (double-stranded beta helix superfamily)
VSPATASATASAVAVPGNVRDGLPGVVGGCPEPLLASIRSAVRAGGDWQEVADRVAGVLRRQLPSPSLLTDEQLTGDPAGYQTHLLHAELDGSFSVTAMVWLPGQLTPVHDHLAWCVTAVMQGTEYEEIFAPASGMLPGATGGAGGLEVIARNENPVGAVSAFAPPGDIHRVHNTGAGTAVSMHVYGTDISRVGASIRRLYAVLSGSGAPALARMPAALAIAPAQGASIRPARPRAPLAGGLLHDYVLVKRSLAIYR